MTICSNEIISALEFSIETLLIQIHQRQLKSHGRSNRSVKISLKIVLLSIIYENVISNTRCSLRDVFYQIKPIFNVSQRKSDDMVSEIAKDFGLPRPSLNIIPASRGIASGEFIFRGQSIGLPSTYAGEALFDEKALDERESYSKFYTLSIPGDFTPDDISYASGTHVLIIEKDCIFQRIVHEKCLRHNLFEDFEGEQTTIWHRYRLVCVTASGFPDLATRSFVQCLVSKFNMIALGLVDYNPFGIRILTTYRQGAQLCRYSQCYDHETEDPHQIDVRWLGVHGRDICSEFLQKKKNDTHVLPLMKLSKRDRNVLRGLLSDPCVPQVWKDDIKTYMTSFKAEIQSLYLAEKIQDVHYFPPCHEENTTLVCTLGTSSSSLLSYIERQIATLSYL